jgi:peptidyl-prolyl cis-trans isomerase C
MSEQPGLDPIRIDGKALPEAAVAAEMQYRPAKSIDESRLAAARAVAVREVLCRRAVELGLLAAEATAEPAIVQAIEDILEQEVNVPPADEAACKAWFEAKGGELRSPDLLEAQHILFAAAPDDPEGRSAALAAAQATLVEVERSPDRFEALAKAHSAGPSASQGGWLGQIVRGTTVPEFETYLFSLEEGETCAAPVPTRYGYHIVRLLRRADGRPLPYAAVRDQIARQIEERAYLKALRTYIEGLACRYRVEGLDMTGH